MSAPILPDDLWRRMEPLIPRQRRKRRGLFAGRKPEDPRKIMAGIIFCLKTGVPWEYLPATNDFASGRTCRKWMIKWHKARVWQKLFATLLVELQHERKIDWRRAIIEWRRIENFEVGIVTKPTLLPPIILVSYHG